MNIYFDWRLMFIICFDIFDPSHIKRKTQVVTATPKLIPVPAFQEWGSLMSNIVQPSNSWKRPELLGNNKHRTGEASCQPLIQHPNCKDLDDLKFKSAATATDWFCTSLAARTTAARSKCCDVTGRFHEDTRSVSFGSGFVVSECITQHCCMQKRKSKKHKSLSLYLFSCLSCGNYHIVAHWLHISEKIEIAIAPHSSLLYFHSLFFLCLCMAIRHGHCDIIPPNASQLADGLSKPGSWRKLCHNGYTAQGLMTKNSIISILWAFSRGNHRQTICHTQFAHVHVCLGPGISSEIFTSKKRQDRMEPWGNAPTSIPTGYGPTVTFNENKHKTMWSSFLLVILFVLSCCWVRKDDSTEPFPNFHHKTVCVYHQCLVFRWGTGRSPTNGALIGE